ncbi:hypothetical protein L6452_32230 [Arctium lappa]|uniref:Uncharacterized protein n=1 Tax=Arctium lappa TaxID=4217 RepID=A0ACB8Z545_ARCLA|nr:hypothetical protein L6452_32230 [Arctium lappa]
MYIITTIGKYKNEVVEVVIEKVKKLCKYLQNVSGGKGGVVDPRVVIYETTDKMAVDMGIFGECEQSLCKEDQASNFDSEEAQEIVVQIQQFEVGVTL